MKEMSGMLFCHKCKIPKLVYTELLICVKWCPDVSSISDIKQDVQKAVQMIKKVPGNPLWVPRDDIYLREYKGTQT